MWIVPSNHPLYSAFAPEYLVSKEDLNEQSAHFGKSLMWRSKLLLLPIWLRKWKQVYWLQPLFGRMLKHSMHNLFEERYTASLADIPAPHFHLLENKPVKTTNPTYGHLSEITLQQLDLFGASLKMSPITLISDIQQSEKNWKNLVIKLRKESSLRRKLALQQLGRDYSYLRWTTPSSRDWKDTPGMSIVRPDRGGAGRLDQLPRQVFFQAKEDYLNDRGRNPGLISGMNPAWSIRLMGTTLSRTFTALLVTRLWSKSQN